MALTRPKYSQIYDTDYKQSVLVATTADVGNLLATGNMTNSIDGVSLTVNDRILVKDQTDTTQNGIYRVSVVGTGVNGTWIRALDADASDKVTSGLSTVVSLGSVNAAKTFRLTTSDPITLGVSSLTFINPYAAGAAAGSNLQIQFNSLGTLGASANLTFNTSSNTLIITGNVTANNVTGNIIGNVTGNLTGNLTGTILTASQPSITTLGGVTSIGASGSTTLTGILQTAAQTNVTSLGTLTTLTISGALSSGAHTITGSGVTAIINGGTTGVGNIGASGAIFNTVFAKATSAVYADLAENYLSDSNYVAGTVVVFGGTKEITTTTLFADAAVAGVISTNPAYLMNDTLDGQPVALRGRVPVQVQGITRKGDLLVTSSIAGVAVSVGRDSGYGIAVFAKALENKTTTEIGIIEAVII